MSFPRLLFLITCVLFGIILGAAVFKSCRKSKEAKDAPLSARQAPIEIELTQNIKIVPPKENKPVESPVQSSPVNPVIGTKEADLLEADRVSELFNTSGTQLPIVETIVYKSRVSWQKGRPAWLSDYAKYYHTPRHFIARSLHGKPDYLNQDLMENVRFNVYRQDKNFQFYLLADISRCKLFLFYDDLDSKERVLLKTYRVCLGRVEGSRSSGFLTPTGKYSLGNKIAIYEPLMMGHHNREQVEMVTVFGTRWIPFEKEIENCSAPAKGLGLHGVPCRRQGDSEPVQDKSSLGKYESDGCIRFAIEDIEEVFAIITSKPATIEIVKDSQNIILDYMQKEKTLF